MLLLLKSSSALAYFGGEPWKPAFDNHASFSAPATLLGPGKYRNDSASARGGGGWEVLGRLRLFLSDQKP
jgi:hypothetical protein